MANYKNGEVLNRSNVTELVAFAIQITLNLRLKHTQK
jgi:hypothetical protein